MTLLLYCPFCGERHATIERLGDRSKSTIYNCNYCGCVLETGEEWNHGNGWNRRYYDLVGVAEIAEMAGVSRAAVSNWKLRKHNFPKPVLVLSSGPFFEKMFIEEWLKSNPPRKKLANKEKI